MTNRKAFTNQKSVEKPKKHRLTTTLDFSVRDPFQAFELSPKSEGPLEATRMSTGCP